MDEMMEYAMIRTFEKNDLDVVMQIWLDTNVEAHNFIPEEYWTDHYQIVKNMLPRAEIYVYEDDSTSKIEGFIGLSDYYIEGIFVRDAMQSRGIGRQLLNFVKSVKPALSLSVYQKNTHAVFFYQREQFVIQSENIDDSTGEKEFIMTWGNR